MRRFLACILMLLVVLTSAGVATAKENPKLTTMVGDSYAIMMSDYELKLNGYGDGENTPILWVSVKKSRMADIITSKKSYEMYISVLNLDSMPNPIIFSAKHSPYFLLVTGADEDSMKITSYSTISNSNISLDVDKKIMEHIFNAEKVYLMLHLSDGNQMKIRMLPEVVSQWQEVINADLKKISKEFKNR